MSNLPMNPPGAPPPPSARRWHGAHDVESDDAQLREAAYITDEMRILDILAQEEGELPLKVLHYRSGLTSDRLRFWLSELEDRGVIEISRKEGSPIAALKGKMS